MLRCGCQDTYFFGMARASGALCKYHSLRKRRELVKGCCISHRSKWLLRATGGADACGGRRRRMTHRAAWLYKGEPVLLGFYLDWKRGPAPHPASLSQPEQTALSWQETIGYCFALIVFKHYRSLCSRLWLHQARLWHQSAVNHLIARHWVPGMMP